MIKSRRGGLDGSFVRYLFSKSLENISINEIVLKHMDNKIAFMWDTKIDTSETFWELYSETFYSLFPDPFNKTDGMLHNGDFSRDEGVCGRKLLASSKLCSMNQLLAYLDKEWEVY